ncbi:MAG: hypothetical protein R3F58_05125 [Steroidobacteraceae bacterium]
MNRLLTASVMVLALAGVAACSGNVGTGEVAPPVQTNQAPRLAGLADTTIDASSSGTVSFTVSDAESAAGELDLSVTSSNPDLLPAEGVAIAGTGATRTAVLTPTEFATGRAALTVTVTDPQGARDSDSVNVDVVGQPTSVRNFTTDVFAKPADEDPVLLSGKDFVSDAADDPTAFDRLLDSATP